MARTHGKRSTYCAGCRCPLCRTAHAAYHRRYTHAQIAAGRCILGNHPAQEGSPLCAAHAAARRVLRRPV